MASYTAKIPHATNNPGGDKPRWETCKQVGAPCFGCGKVDSCTMAPDGTASHCFRDGKTHQAAKGTSRTDKPDDYGRHSKPKAAQRTFTGAEEAIAAYGKGTPDATWKYQDAQGDDVLVIARWNDADGKVIRPVGRVGNGWVQGDPKGPLPLYRLPELLAADPGEIVFVCEGEKACEAARSVGLLATTSAHGAASAAKTDWSALKRFSRICILPDNDAPGEKYAEQVAAILMSLETECRDEH